MVERHGMTEDYRDDAAYAAFLAEEARTAETLPGRQP